MKLVIFVGFRQLGNYGFADLKERGHYRLVALVPQDVFPTLSQSIVNQFDAIYDLAFTFADSEKIFQVIDFAAAVKVIEKEQLQHPKANLSILTQDEPNVLVAAQLRQHFQCASITEAEDSFKVFRDKVLMKRFLANKGIRVPRFESFNSHKTPFSYLENKLGLPFILKPKSSAGSQGIYKIVKEVDFDEFYAKDAWNKEAYEAEEFIEGKLYHCDSFISNGVIQFHECCEYTWPNFDYRNNKIIGSIPLLANDPVRESLLTFSRKVLYAFGMPTGIQHLELFLKSNNEIVFLEIGARAPGALAIKMYEKSFAINLLQLELSTELGAQFKESSGKKLWSFWCFFPPHQGKIKALVPPSIQSQYEINWKAKVGDSISACQSLAENLGSLLVWNEDYEMLYRDFLSVKNHVAVIYE